MLVNRSAILYYIIETMWGAVFHCWRLLTIFKRYRSFFRPRVQLTAYRKRDRFLKIILNGLLTLTGSPNLLSSKCYEISMRHTNCGSLLFGTSTPVVPT